MRGIVNEHVVITDTNLGDGSHESALLSPPFDVSCFQLKTEDEVLTAAEDAVGLLVQWAPITERVFTGLPKLRAVVRYGIGLDNIDLAAAERAGIAVRNVDDYCLAEVADHSTACILAHNRRLTAGSRSVARFGWTTAGIAPPLPPARDPVGIAGFGRIGREVARRVAALGFSVHAWDPYVSEFPAGVQQHQSLDDLAAAVNHLTLHIPSSETTRGIVDTDVLRALGSRGHLVNTARGALVDEDALLSALNCGDLGFASLDVLTAEPPTGVAAQLANHDQVIVTPHIAYLSEDSLPRLRKRAAEILRDMLTGTV